MPSDYAHDIEVIRQIVVQSKYSNKLVSIAHREQTEIIFELDDVALIDKQLANSITENTKRYVTLFSTVLDELLPNYRLKDVVAKDPLDVFIEHRLLAEQRTYGDVNGEINAIQSKYPPELMRRYDVYFKPLSTEKPTAIRDVKAKDIGRLVTIAGIVTRITEVSKSFILIF